MFQAFKSDECDKRRDRRKESLMRQAIATVKRQKRFKKSIRFSQRKALDRILLLNRVLLKRLPMQQFNQEMNWFLRLVLELGL